MENSIAQYIVNIFENIILLLQVHWVQCDGCELWLHLTCIGLKPEQVSEDEDFICRDCKPAPTNSKRPKV